MQDKHTALYVRKREEVNNFPLMVAYVKRFSKWASPERLADGCVM